MAARIAMAVVLVAGCSSSGGGAQESPRVVSRTARRPGQAPPASTSPPTTTTAVPPTAEASIGRTPTSAAHRPAPATVAPPPPVVSPTPVEAGSATTHGRASWYARGARTASGERFDPDGLTAAHRTLAFGTRLRVCHDGCVEVEVNDRGPARWTGRDLDLSRAAFATIAPLGAGVVDVTWSEAA